MFSNDVFFSSICSPYVSVRFFLNDEHLNQARRSMNHEERNGIKDQDWLIRFTRPEGRETH